MKRYFKWILVLAGAIVIVLLLRSFAFTSCLIPSVGMENSLFRGERIVINKWSYGLRAPLMSFFSYHRWGEKKPSKEDIVVFNNPANISEPVIDKREVFISRCVGIPGDTLLIDSLFTIVSPQSASFSPDRKRFYNYPKTKEQQLDSLLSILSITPNEPMGQDSIYNIRSFSRYEYYLLEQAMTGKNWLTPLDTGKKNNTANPLIIPGKGRAVRVYPWNRTLLRNTLVLHEGRQAEIKNDTLYVNGHPTQHCYFTKDYYWMASNNSANLSDSRLFGFVPQDHIIGKASFVWFSRENSANIFSGYRWNRFFSPIQ